MAQSHEGGDLGFGEWAIAIVMARIDQFDADGAGVNVDGAGPIGDARMPGSSSFWNMGINGAVLVDGIMGRDVGGRIAKPLKGSSAGYHAGVMQYQHVHRCAL